MAMTIQAKNLRDAAVEATGLGARSWRVRTELNRRSYEGHRFTEYGDANLSGRGREARNALVAKAGKVAELNNCRVTVCLFEGGGFDVWASSEWRPGGQVTTINTDGGFTQTPAAEYVAVETTKRGRQ